jgi:hypothetical protein
MPVRPHDELTRPARADATHSARLPKTTARSMFAGAYQAHLPELVMAIRALAASIGVTYVQVSTTSVAPSYSHRSM